MQIGVKGVGITTLFLWDPTWNLTKISPLSKQLKCLEMIPSVWHLHLESVTVHLQYKVQIAFTASEPSHCYAEKSIETLPRVSTDIRCGQINYLVLFLKKEEERMHWRAQKKTVVNINIIKIIFIWESLYCIHIQFFFRFLQFNTANFIWFYLFYLF